MCIYCKRKSNDYRRIYEQHYGTIPIDEDGVTFDIHHIDGNHDNNSPDNLKALSILDHYQIHFEQGDWNACYMLSKKLDKKLSKEQRSELATLQNIKRIKDGTHHFLTNEYLIKLSESAKRRVDNGTHPFLGKFDLQKKLVKSGNHNLLGGELQRKLVKEGRHGSQIQYKCPHCNKEGKGAVMKRYHFDNCILLKPIRNKSLTHSSNAKKLANKLILDRNHHSQKIHVCNKCKKEGKGNRFKSLHFQNCSF